jgi:hypothetical protein
VAANGCDSIAVSIIAEINRVNPIDSIYGSQQVDTTQPYAYFVTLDFNATSYTWQTDCGTITTGQGTNAVNILWDDTTACNLTVTAANSSCSETRTITVTQNSNTSVKDLSSLINIQLYPNPTAGKTTISWNSNLNLQPEKIILDALGRQINKAEIIYSGSNTCVLDMKLMASGIYTLMLKTNKGNATKKLIKTE